MRAYMAEQATLPQDAPQAVLAGRVWRPELAGPSIGAVRRDGVYDISRHAPTMRDLCEAADAVAIVGAGHGERIGALAEILANTPEASRDDTKPWLLAPCDLQAIRAAGVTFARSLIERVIEEQAKGAPDKAEAVRRHVHTRLGGDLRNLKPGSPEALELKNTLIAAGAWSQYLEVGIGEDAEIFTKAQPMSAVGHGMDAGLHPRSTWSNPEPEAVLVVNGAGRIVGATLGNDVNLRDFEGRSALLLSKAKDNNASAALGPFIRQFDATFTLDTVRQMDVHLTVIGIDGFRLAAKSSMSEIARDPADLVAELFGGVHQYPDGALLYLGTMFAPVADRGRPGMGFTHQPGDIVTIRAAEVGSLTNRMTTSDQAPAWTFGTGALMRNLAKRGLL